MKNHFRKNLALQMAKIKKLLGLYQKAKKLHKKLRPYQILQIHQIWL